MSFISNRRPPRLRANMGGTFYTSVKNHFTYISVSFLNEAPSLRGLVRGCS